MRGKVRKVLMFFAGVGVVEECRCGEQGWGLGWGESTCALRAAVVEGGKRGVWRTWRVAGKFLKSLDIFRGPSMKEHFD
jgi:hypothetical protein